jgi:hypothetical protein
MDASQLKQYLAYFGAWNYWAPIEMVARKAMKPCDRCTSRRRTLLVARCMWRVVNCCRVHGRQIAVYGFKESVWTTHVL